MAVIEFPLEIKTSMFVILVVMESSRADINIYLEVEWRRCEVAVHAVAAGRGSGGRGQVPGHNVAHHQVIIGVLARLRGCGLEHDLLQRAAAPDLRAVEVPVPFVSLPGEASENREEVQDWACFKMKSS